MLGIENIIKIKGKKWFEDLNDSEVAEMILADSAMSPKGNDKFSACALDEFLNHGGQYSPKLEKIRQEINDEIYIDIPGQQTREINVAFLKKYSAKLSGT